MFIYVSTYIYIYIYIYREIYTRGRPGLPSELDLHPDPDVAVPEKPRDSPEALASGFLQTTLALGILKGERVFWGPGAPFAVVAVDATEPL